MNRLIYFFSAALLAAQLNAQQQTPFELDRNTAVQRALHGNRDLRAARLSIEQAQGRTIDAGSLDNPSLNFTGSSDFAFSNEGEYGWSIGLEQSFPITDRLKRLENIATLEVQLAELEVRNAERQLALKVERLLDGLYFIDANLALHEEQIALNQRFADFLEKKIERAEASSLDLGQVKVSLAALNQKVLQLQRSRAVKMVQLRGFLGLDSQQPITIAPPRHDGYEDTGLPEFKQSLLEDHPAYILHQQLAKLATEKTELARAERWEDIAVEVFFEQGLANNAMEEPFTGNVRVGPERERFLGIGLSIPLPLNNQNRGEIVSRQARVRQLDAELDALAFRLQNEATGIRSEFETVQAQLEKYEQTVLTQAEKNLNELENAYSIGQLDLTAVFRAQERLLDLKVDFAQLNAERQSLITRWRYVVGSNIPEPLKSDTNED